VVLDKKTIVEAMKGLPEDATVEDAIDYLLYLDGIDKGLEDVKAGRVITTEELIERIKSWAR
jgi:predicted transcriptional regulator